MTTATEKPAILTKEALFAEIDKVVAEAIKVPKPSESAEKLNDPPWMANMNRFIHQLQEGPKPGQFIEILPDGTYRMADIERVEMEARRTGSRQGFLSFIEAPLNKAAPMGIPLGSIAVGGVIGMVVGELVDGLVPPTLEQGKVNFPNLGVKALAILGIGAFGKMFMSSTGTLVAISILGAQILADILPLDRFIQWLMGLFGGAKQEQIARQIPGATYNQPFPIASPENDVLARIW